MTARELLAQAAATLHAAGCDTPRLDAELLLMHAWEISRTGLIMRMPDMVPDSVGQRFTAMLAQRQQRVPVAYITGNKEFWSHDFIVTPDVLVPRPETEHLIEELLQLYPDQNGPWHFCDIGTGSGCIAVTLASEYPNAHITATDISEQSLAVAQRNAERHHVDARITFRCGDMFSALLPSDGPFDAIVSNPPYVAEDEMAALAPELMHEPYHALTDSRDGLHYLELLVRHAPEHLRAHGHLIVETGLCGLPEGTATMPLLCSFEDLAGRLRGGVYKAAK